MAADKALRLGFILSATDKMSRIVDQAVKKSSKSLSSFERTTGQAGRSMVKAGGIMVGAGAAVGAATFALANSTAAYGNEISKASQQVGVGVEELQKLAHAAKFSNIESVAFTQSLQELNKKAVAAVSGSKEAGRAFSDLGIKLKDSEGNMRKPNEIFEDVAELFHDIEDGATKTALAGELFGGSGAKLIPMLNMGKAGLKNMGDEAVRMGLVLGKDAIKACDEFNENLTGLKNGAQGLKVQLGTALMPTFNELIKKVNDIVGRVMGWVRENPKLASTIGKVAVGAAGLLLVLGTAAVLIGGFIAMLGQFAKAWTIVTKAIAVGKAVILAAKNGMLLFRIQYAGLVVWQKLAAAAQWLFNTALFGCPIIWIIAGVMAVIAAVVLLVKNWDKVSAFFKRLWDKIKGIFKSVWEWIKKMFLNFTPYGLIIKHWDVISGFFVRLWGKVKDGIRKGWETIKRLFLNYTPYGLIIKHWDKIAGFFTRLWDSVKTGVVTAWNSIGDFFGGLGGRFFEWGKNLLQSLWNGITSMVSKVVEGIKNVGKKIASGFKSIFGINSPSKLFMEYGVNITQGLAGGIDNGGGMVSRATEGLAAQTTRGFEGSLNTQPIGGAGGGAAGGVTLHYSPNITIQGDASPQTREDFAKLLRDNAAEVVRILQREAENNQRLSFAY